MIETSDSIDLICGKMIKHPDQEIAPTVEVTLSEFQKYYTSLWKLTGSPPAVSLVNLGTIVIGQFSNVSPQKFGIQTRRFLTCEDFRFVDALRWHGPERACQSFIQFVWVEFRLYWWKLLLVFFTGTGLLYLADDTQLYSVLATLLIQSCTVFLSIFLIFTVAQSQILYRDIELFESGFLEKYYCDDRNVMWLGITAVALTLLSPMVISLLDSYFAEPMASELRVVVRLLKALSMSVTIALLFDTFLSVVDYYLQRSRDLIDRDMASEVLSRDFSEASARREDS